MSAVQFHCPLCAGLFQADDALAGIEVNCPHCQGLVTVPDFSAPTPPPSEAMQLSCPVCTGLFQVTAELSGQQVHCPHCQQVVMTPDFGGAAPTDYSLPPGYSEPPAAPSPSYSPQLPKPSAGTDDANYLYPPGYQPTTAKKEQPAPRTPGPIKPASAERKPLPASIPARSKEAVLIPTDQGYVGVREPVKTIQHHGEEVALRKLTPEEKARRRVVRNTILFLFCVITLIVVTALFMWK